METTILLVKSNPKTCYFTKPEVCLSCDTLNRGHLDSAIASGIAGVTDFALFKCADSVWCMF